MRWKPGWICAGQNRWTICSQLHKLVQNVLLVEARYQTASHSKAGGPGDWRQRGVAEALVR
jgi:hypothetical protein